MQDVEEALAKMCASLWARATFVTRAASLHQP
jgi:hypothetical protein